MNRNIAPRFEEHVPSLVYEEEEPEIKFKWPHQHSISFHLAP